MTIDPRTPVLIGAAAVSQREEDPAAAHEPLELMAQALEGAADDAGDRGWLARADLVLAPRGFWEYRDPCRALAERFGASSAKTLVAELGVLQTTLFAEAVRAIQSGGADVVAITGGEAKYRSLRAQITGGEAPQTQQPEGAAPDRVLEPHTDIMHPLEIELDLAMPVKQYSMIENALRHSEGQAVDAHRREVAALWAGMSEVASKNPRAWRREAWDTEALAFPSERNPMLAFPYTKLENSQWNVDQAAGLILCSYEAARAAGVPAHQCVFPRAVADSNHMRTLAERKHIHRVPGFEVAGRVALERAGIAPDEVGPAELYSCFPVAVRSQQREIGLPLDRPVTVTGGMAFAGGPLNNFVLQAAVAMVEALRADPGTVGMLNAVSGILTKQGVSLWSTEPPQGEAPLCHDVSAEVERLSEGVTVDPAYQGEATICGYTVLHTGGQPTQAAALCDAPDGRRAVALSAEPEVMAAMQRDEFVGRRVTIGPERALRL